MHNIPVPPPPQTTAIYRGFKKSTAISKGYNVGLRYIKQIIYDLIYITRGWILVRCGRLWKGLKAPGRLRVRQDHPSHGHRAQVQPLRNLHGAAEKKGK